MLKDHCILVFSFYVSSYFPTSRSHSTLYLPLNFSLHFSIFSIPTSLVYFHILFLNLTFYFFSKFSLHCLSSFSHSTFLLQFLLYFLISSYFLYLRFHYLFSFIFFSIFSFFNFFTHFSLFSHSTFFLHSIHQLSRSPLHIPHHTLPLLRAFCINLFYFILLFLFIVCLSTLSTFLFYILSLFSLNFSLDYLPHLLILLSLNFVTLFSHSSFNLPLSYSCH